MSELYSVEVTQGVNGYPVGIYRATAGFDTFEEAQRYAENCNSTVILLHRRDGWNLWESKGWATEPIRVNVEDMGDDCESYTKSCTKEQFAENALDFLRDMAEDGIEAMYEFVKNQKEIWQEIGRLEENEQVIACCGRYYDTLPIYTMEHQYDTHHYLIAVRDKAKYVWKDSD